MSEFERRVLDELAEIRRDVRALTEEVGNMKGTVAAISSLVGAVVAGLVVAVAMGLIGGCASLPDDRPAYADLEATVVALVRDDGTAYCAGTSTPRGVLTAAHCVDDALGGTVSVGTRSGLDADGTRWSTVHTLPVVAVDVAHDVARLGILPERLAGRALPRPFAAELGEPVTVVGHGYSIPYLAHSGRVSREAGDAMPSWPMLRWFGIDAQVAPGFSGGGVFDRSGRLLGVLSFAVGPNISGAIPVDLVP